MGLQAIGWINRCRTGAATVSGGDWLAALPESNVLNPKRSDVARSTTDGAADTILTIDFSTSQSIRAVAFDFSNLTTSAQWKVKLGTTSGASDVYSGSLVNYMQATGVENVSDYGGSIGADMPAIMVLSQAYTAASLTIEIVDESNPDTYVDVGYVWAGPLLIPELGVEHGSLSSGMEDETLVTRPRGGGYTTSPAGRIKTVAADFADLTAAEAIVWHEAMRINGKTGRMLWIPDIDDMAKTQREGFIGVARDLSSLDHPRYARRGAGVMLEAG